MKLNLPNIFSLLRMIVSPIIFLLIVFGDKSSVIAAIILYVFAAITDYLDGWFARRYGEETNWGKFIDPLADKFLTTFAFLAFVMLDIIPLWMVIIIIVRDFGTTFLRLYGDKLGKPLVTSYTAKVKTFIQMGFIALILLLLLLLNIESPALDKQNLLNILHSNSIYIIMLVLTVITVWTLIEYLYQNKKVNK